MTTDSDRPGFLIQSNPSSYEGRSVLRHCLTHDIPVKRAQLGAIAHELGVDLGHGRITPVGSVEFVREAMAVGRVQEPAVDGYPLSLRPYLERDIALTTRDEAGRRSPCFVRPAQMVKAFSGFLLGLPAGSEKEQEYLNEQMTIWRALPSTFPVYVSQIVAFEQEWRAYVLGEKIIGLARYDDGESADSIDLETVRDMVSTYSASGEAPAAYSLDVGRLEGSGATRLVEVNDAWALGLYPSDQMLDTAGYLQMLQQRWQELCQHSPKG